MRSKTSSNLLVSMVVIASLAALAGACGEEEGPEMLPGEACLRCHGPGGEADDEAFGAAGTVYADGQGTAGLQGVTVTVEDSRSVKASAVTNAVGNFHINRALTPPLKVSLSQGGKVVSMVSAAASGDCNTCHSPAGARQQRLHLP